MNMATVAADRVAESLDDIQETPLWLIPKDQANDIVRRIVDNEQQVSVLEVAAFNSAV